MYASAALMQHSAVMFFPRSPLDTFRICRIPVVPNTLPDFATVVNPVSSQFHMCVALYVPAVMMLL